VQIRRHPHVTADPEDDGVASNIHRLVAGEEHLDPGEHQEGGEKVQHPIGFGQQGRAPGDHQAAQDDDRDDAPQ